MPNPLSSPLNPGLMPETASELKLPVIPPPRREEGQVELFHVRSDSPAAGGKLENLTAIGTLYEQLKREQAATNQRLGKDPTKCREDLDRLADVAGVETLMRKWREQDLLTLNPETRESGRREVERIERELRPFLSDRIERYQVFNRLIDEGKIDLRRLVELATERDSGGIKRAHSELRAVFAADVTSARVPLEIPVEGNVRPTGVVKYGVPVVPGEDLSSDRLRRSPAETSVLLRAVQDRFQKVSESLGSEYDSRQILHWTGAREIGYALEAYASAKFELARCVDPARQRQLATAMSRAESRLRVGAIDFVERADAVCTILRSPETRESLLRDLNPKTRAAHQTQARTGGRNEDAETYHTASRNMIRLMQQSPAQILAAGIVMPPDEPVRPLVPAGRKDPRGVLVSARSETAREHVAKASPAVRAVDVPRVDREDFSGLAPASGPAGRIRAQAFERCCSAMTEVVKVALGTRMHSPAGNGRDSTAGMLDLAARTFTVRSYDLEGELGAKRMLTQTNTILSRATTPGSELHQLLELRSEMQKSLDLAKKVEKTPDGYEKKLLEIREAFGARAAALIESQFPMLRHGELNVQECLLSSKEIVGMKALYLRNAVLAASVPPAPLRADNHPPLIVPRREAPVLDTSNRQGILAIPPTETSRIVVRGRVDGKDTVVVYDAFKGEILSDRGLAEDSGVRFVPTGETGKNGFPVVRVELTRPGTFSMEYTVDRYGTIARWSGDVHPRPGTALNPKRLEEARAAGDDVWHVNLPSAAVLPDGKKFQYVYSSTDSRLYARSPDGRQFVAYDPNKQAWHNIREADLPPPLRRSV